MIKPLIVDPHGNIPPPRPEISIHLALTRYADVQRQNEIEDAINAINKELEELAKKFSAAMEATASPFEIQRDTLMQKRDELSHEYDHIMETAVTEYTEEVPTVRPYIKSGDFLRDSRMAPGTLLSQ